jgi:hypothetical protein
MSQRFETRRNMNHHFMIQCSEYLFKFHDFRLAYKTTVAEEDIIRVSDDNGNVIELLESGEEYLSARAVIAGRYPNPKTNFPRLKAMDVKSDDIFLYAYPKAGKSIIDI